MNLKNEFLITKKNNLKGFHTKEALSENYFLYADSFIRVSVAENSNEKLVIIGDLYDYKNPSFTNQEIAESIIAKPLGFRSALEKSFRYSGTYLLVYCNKREDFIRVITDLAAQRETFYVTNSNNNIIGSNPKMINFFFPQKKDNSPEAVEFYNSPQLKNRLSFVTDFTNYTTIRRLKPNHYFDFSKHTAVRYFPTEKISPQDVNVVAKRAAEMIKGYIKAASLRNKLLLAVTAGWDSRLLLAACKEIKNDVGYFVLAAKKSALKEYDIQIPKKLFKILGLPFVVGESFAELNKEDKLLAKDKFEFPKYGISQKVKNFYFRNYPNHTVVNGNISEIARLEFDEIFNLTAKKIAYIEKYPFLDYSLDRYSKWFSENKTLFEQTGFRVLDMLYWEENCANWMAKSKSEFGAYGIEKFAPFNSRELILALMSVDKKYRRKQNPVLYKLMIEHLWPEVMQVPLNPGLKKRAMRITQKLGVFAIFRNLKLNYYLYKGRKKWS